MAFLGAILPVGAQLPQLPLATGQASPRPREVLFLGRQVTVHHSPTAFHSLMRLPWAERNLRMKFTIDLADLNPGTLGAHDALFVYGNAFYQVTPDQANAMEQYANGGGGVAAMHVACWSSPHSAKITSIIGGAFLGHYAFQEFTQTILDVDHPILKGLGTYTSVDEPYQFKDLMPDRTILTVRPGPGPETEMTWVRQQGLGRVFYHSGGHDAQTWVQPNFQEIVTRGIEWVAKPGDGPAVAGIDLARIGNGGAIAVRASLAGPGVETRDAVFTLHGGRWNRPLLEDETLYDLGSGIHAPEAADALRVGGDAAVPVLAMTSKFTDAALVPRWGLWGARGGLARVLAREASGISWGSGYLPIAAPPPGSVPELVMNASGTMAARVFVTREGFPELDTALVRAATGAAEPTVIGVEGEDLGSVESPWLCGDLGAARLSLNGPGHLAATIPGVAGARLMFDSGSGWTPLLQTGEGIPGLTNGETLEALRNVRLNDAGGLAVAATLNGGGGAILRRNAGSADWAALVKDGPQSWLGAGELLVLPADGAGCLIDPASNVWLLAGAELGGVTKRCLLKISAAGAVELLCREGNPLSLGGETVTVSALGLPSEWSCGPGGVACGRMTVMPSSGPERDLLVRWNGRHPLPVIEAGKVFHSGAGDLAVGSFRVDGGGTAEDGKGGFLTSGGEWVATVTVAGGGDRLVHGSSVADLDGDGRDDLLEVALGGDPTQADAGAPLLGIQPVPAGAKLRFLQLQNGPFTYAVEASTDLQSWLPADALPVLAADQTGAPAGYQRMECSLTGAGGFARIRVDTD